MKRKPWNKGLTKETDERLKKTSKKLKEIKKGKLLSEEHKNNIHKGHIINNGKAWFEIKLRNYVRIRDNNLCQNPYCNDGKPQRHCINLDTHHCESGNDDFWKIITLCSHSHQIAKNTNLEYWNTIFLQTLKKKKQTAIEYIKKNRRFSPELSELMNDTEFLDYYKSQNLSPIFEKEIINFK